VISLPMEMISAFMVSLVEDRLRQICGLGFRF
jgi:hypothetical protein